MWRQTCQTIALHTLDPGGHFRCFSTVSTPSKSKFRPEDRRGTLLDPLQPSSKLPSSPKLQNRVFDTVLRPHSRRIPRLHAASKRSPTTTFRHLKTEILTWRSPGGTHLSNLLPHSYNNPRNHLTLTLHPIAHQWHFSTVFAALKTRLQPRDRRGTCTVPFLSFPPLLLPHQHAKPAKFEFSTPFYHGHLCGFSSPSLPPINLCCDPSAP